MRKGKNFWIYILIVGIIYISFFAFVNNKISGSFSLNPPMEKVNFLEIPSSYYLDKRQAFSLDIDYLEGYVFSDNTALFNITETTGEISFVPFESGNYPVVLIALKNITEFETKVVIFEVGN